VIQSPRAPLPTLLVAGYLGAGKTTLVNHLLRHAGGRRIAVLVNDFGTLSIDADLIEGAAGEVLALAGGCVCCAYGADLVSALRQMDARTPRPDHLLIETSGVALPAAVARTAGLVAEVRIEAILVLADASTLRERARERYTGELVRDQLAQADLVLLNQLDRLVPEGGAAGASPPAELLAWLHELGVRAPVLGSSFGRIDPQLAWGPIEQRHERARGSAGEALALQSPRRAADLFEFETLRFEGAVDIAALSARLADPGSRLLRAKGVLQAEDGEVVVLQAVGRRVSCEPAPRGATAHNRVAIIRARRA
jgi:G3E family GTPase